MSVTIAYDVYTYELVPTKVSNPILGEFTAPALVGSLALLALSVAIPTRQALGVWITRRRQGSPTSSPEWKT